MRLLSSRPAQRGDFAVAEASEIQRAKPYPNKRIQHVLGALVGLGCRLGLAGRRV